MKRIASLVMTLVLMFAARNTAHAQLGLIPIHVGIAGGGAIPLNDFGNTFNTGFDIGGVVAVTPPLIPLGIRVDAAYNQFGSKGTSSLKAKIAEVTGDVTWGLPGAIVTPYLIGGVGYYHLSSSLAGGSSASNHFGINVGGGLNLPLLLFKGFVEARYHRVSQSGGSTSFVPVTIGLLF